jgi:hypothetical protein
MTATGGGRPQGRPEESRESLPAPSGPYRRPTLAGVLGLVAPHDHGEERRLPAPAAPETATRNMARAISMPEECRNLGLFQRGSLSAEAAELGEPGGQGRDRTADLAVFSRWTPCAVGGMLGDAAAHLASGRASLVTIRQDSR